MCCRAVSHLPVRQSLPRLQRPFRPRGPASGGIGQSPAVGSALFSALRRLSAAPSLPPASPVRPSAAPSRSLRSLAALAPLERLGRFLGQILAYVLGMRYLWPCINQLITITMAKGNMLLGYARGKVGSLVFARRKGEQITRARNFAPANPRTNAQMSQRMKMYAPVQLYRQSMRRFFKFAFNTAAHETIFNAYMRENIALAPWVSKELSVGQAPIPFPAKMSSGGLAGATMQVSANNVTAGSLVGILAKIGNYSGVSMVTGLTAADSTLGQISAAILAANPSLQVGDQLTFVLCFTSGLQSEAGDILYDGRSPFNFVYAKFVLDPESTRTPADAGLVHFAEEEDFGTTFLTLASSVDLATDAAGGCIIVTRNVSGSVIASNSQLFLNEVADEIYNLMRTDAYREKAALSYKASPDAYLNPATTEV